MSYSIKSSLLADMIALVLVDEDGSTITDLVPGNAISLDTGVAASVATGSWKSMTAPKYFVTTANGAFNFNGVRWTNSPLSTVAETDSDGMCAGFCCAGASNASQNGAPFIEVSNAPGNGGGLARVSTSDARARYFHGGGTFATTTSNVPTDGTTQFMLASNYRGGVSSEAFFGFEAGSPNSILSENTAGPDGDWGGTNLLLALGGSAGQDNQPFKPYVVWVARRFFTLSEYEEIHADWKEFFLTPAAAGTDLTGSAMTASQRAPMPGIAITL